MLRAGLRTQVQLTERLGPVTLLTVCHGGVLTHLGLMGLAKMLLAKMWAHLRLFK